MGKKEFISFTGDAARLFVKLSASLCTGGFHIILIEAEY